MRTTKIGKTTPTGRGMALSLARFLVLVPLASLGCLDVVVIHVEPTSVDAGDAGPNPVEQDATIDAGPHPCEACIRAPSRPGYGCGDSLAACFTNDQCKGTMECAIPSGCFELEGQGAIIDCGIPCGREAGLDLSTPALQLVLDVVACGQEVCGPICRGEVEAGTPDASVE